MGICPVCEKENNHLVCSNCGFDGSRNVERYPTVTRLNGEIISMAGLRAAYQQKLHQRTIRDMLFCPDCGGNQFAFVLSSMSLACPNCGRKISNQQMLAFHDTYIETRLRSKLEQKSTAENTQPPIEQTVMPPKSRGTSLKFPVYQRISPKKHEAAFLCNGNVLGAVGVRGLEWDSLWNQKDIVFAVAGAGHLVGLCKDGTVVARAKQNVGQCSVETWKDIVAIAAGSYHTVGVCKDGTVVATGYNADGQCNVASWENIVSVAAGRYHTVGLRKDGTVVAVGMDKNGRCDVSGWKDIVSVAAGLRHTVGLRRDGTVVVAGLFKQPAYWKNIVAIGSGSNHIVGLCENGAVVSMDSNGKVNYSLQGWREVIAIGANHDCTLGLLKDGTVLSVV